MTLDQARVGTAVQSPKNRHRMIFLLPATLDRHSGSTETSGLGEAPLPPTPPAPGPVGAKAQQAAQAAHDWIPRRSGIGRKRLARRVCTSLWRTWLGRRPHRHHRSSLVSRSQTAMSMDGAQTECCGPSSCGPGRVSRRFQDGRFSVSISVGVKTVPRSLLAYPVSISARGNDRKLCQHAVSNHRLVAVGGARAERSCIR